mmetsp:Transcript_59762/g.151373  ORF Transcript_59762/g.151373 Transcript_59762/m.151373 type:complete len:296 (-) Transcript_59762:234-1121(-)
MAHLTAAYGAGVARRRPKPVKKQELKDIGSYEKVLATFRKYDVDGNGVMDYKELHRLMTDLNNGNWTDVESDRLFLQLDKNKSGSIDVNEFLSSIFQRDPGMGGSSGMSDYEKVLEQFRSFDTNRNGTLDKREFRALMSSIQPGRWDAARVEAVYKQVDCNASGEVDLNELIAYLFGVPKDRARAAQNGSGPLVVIEITCGKGQPEIYCQQIANVFKRHFGSEVAVAKIVRPNQTCISRVTARNGQVVFWDNATMLAHRDNPFLTIETLKSWVLDMTNRHIPRLLDGTKVATGVA